MKRNIFYALFIILATVAIFSSCEKSDDTTHEGSDISKNTELLSRIWNAPAFTDDCGDEYILKWTFTSSGIYTMQIALTDLEISTDGVIINCSTEIETHTANWSWSDVGESSISLAFENGGSMEFEIVELTEQKLSFKVSDTEMVTYTAE